MIKKTILGAIALTISTSAFAAETAAPAQTCCCCKKDEDGKMACCDKHEAVGKSEAGHHDHAM